MSAPFAKATLVKHRTDDGLCEVRRHVQLGKVYLVDLSSIRDVTLFNLEQRRFHTKSVIDAVNAHGRSVSWFALELLRIEES